MINPNRSFRALWFVMSVLFVCSIYAQNDIQQTTTVSTAALADSAALKQDCDSFCCDRREIFDEDIIKLIRNNAISYIEQHDMRRDSCNIYLWYCVTGRNIGLNRALFVGIENTANMPWVKWAGYSIIDGYYVFLDFLFEQHFTHRAEPFEKKWFKYGKLGRAPIPCVEWKFNCSEIRGPFSLSTSNIWETARFYPRDDPF